MSDYMNDALTTYVENRLRAGVVKAEIQEELLAVGWSEEEGIHAYKAALVSSGLPVPVEGDRKAYIKKSATVDVIVNFFSFILLSISAFSLGTLFFQVINKFIADPLDTTKNYYWYDQSWNIEAIHYAMASLLISYPLYVLTMRIWFKRFREDEGRSESKLTKWLTYLVLLIASVTIVGDLITVVFTFLQGEVTLRFFTKALVIFVIASLIFVFYYLERKRVQYQADTPRPVLLMFAVFTTLIVVFGIILGFIAGGSPTEERNRVFDMQRASDLNEISNCITSFADEYGTLPATLDDLRVRSNLFYCSGVKSDPETFAPYTYKIINPRVLKGNLYVGEYELCATFARTSEETRRQSNYNEQTGDWYTHTAGYECDTARAVVDSKGQMPPVVMPPTPTQNTTSTVENVM